LHSCNVKNANLRHPSSMC